MGMTTLCQQVFRPAKGLKKSPQSYSSFVVVVVLVLEEPLDVESKL
jgi:hypothetical protein